MCGTPPRIHTMPQCPKVRLQRDVDAVERGALLSVLIDEVKMLAGDIDRVSIEKGKAVGVSAAEGGLWTHWRAFGWRADVSWGLGPCPYLQDF